MFGKWDGRERDDSRKTSQTLLSEAEEGGIQVILELSGSKIRVSLIEKNWERKDLRKES